MRPPQTVLVVDDDADVLQAVEDVLRQNGYATARAADGAEALTYLRANVPPDLILLDLLMPVMNGWDLIARLRADPELASIPVVLITALADHWGYPLLRERTLTKPLDAELVIQVVDEVLGRVRPAPSA
jgi:CheY-like chemotaxis protein